MHEVNGVQQQQAMREDRTERCLKLIGEKGHTHVINVKETEPQPGNEGI